MVSSSVGVDDPKRLLRRAVGVGREDIVDSERSEGSSSISAVLDVSLADFVDWPKKPHLVVDFFGRTGLLFLREIGS